MTRSGRARQPRPMYGDSDWSGESFFSQDRTGRGDSDFSRTRTDRRDDEFSQRPRTAAPPRPKSSANYRQPKPKAQPLPQLRKGDMIRHTAFGSGMVLSVQPMGGDALVEIAFDNVGTKRMLLKSAAPFMSKL